MDIMILGRGGGGEVDIFVRVGGGGAWWEVGKRLCGEGWKVPFDS